MYKFLTKNGQVLAFGLGALITLLFLVFVLSGLDDFSMLDKDAKVQSNLFNFGMYAGIALVVVCALGMLVFGVLQIASNPKGSMKGIIGLVAILVLFFIAKSMAAPASAGLSDAMSKYNVTDGTFSWISGAINTTLIIGALAVAALFISEIRNFFK